MNGFVNLGFLLSVAKRRRRSVSESIAGANASYNDMPLATWEMNVSTKGSMAEGKPEETSNGFDDGEDVEKVLTYLSPFYNDAPTPPSLLGRVARSSACLSTPERPRLPARHFHSLVVSSS